jgi:hypothetical protein
MNKNIENVTGLLLGVIPEIVDNNCLCRIAVDTATL